MFKGGCSSFPYFVLGQNQNNDVCTIFKQRKCTKNCCSDETRKIIQQLHCENDGACKPGGINSLIYNRILLQGNQIISS